MKPTDNLLVVLEEIGGNPDGIQILTVNRDTICGFITERHPLDVKSWKGDGGTIRTVVDDVKPAAHLMCPDSKEIVQVDFASYGNPSGACGSYTAGNCTAANSKKIVEQVTPSPL